VLVKIVNNGNDGFAFHSFPPDGWFFFLFLRAMFLSVGRTERNRKSRFRGSKRIFWLAPNLLFAACGYGGWVKSCLLRFSASSRVA
ncbi:MAG: hypothetical protein IKD11_01250, partial [Oscillospiraceae bacterium]|nr:hypothetical protein [Oscillospiraceae bacterium]